MMEPGHSSVVSRDTAGRNPRWFGQMGHVAQLSYSYVNPGGADQLSCLLQIPTTERTTALDPGRIIQVFRGGQCVWDGKLMEPVAGPDGWSISAIGVGNQGTDFLSYYTTTWGSSWNEPINRACARDGGLRWTNPGGSLTAPYAGGSIPSDVWLGQAVDPGSQTITDLLNLYCTKGGKTWYVKTGPTADGPGGYFGNNVLSVYSLPANTAANVNRILVSTEPVSRTLGGDINSIFLRYQDHNEDKHGPATTAVVIRNDTRSIINHQRIETYEDVTSAGTYGAAAIQALGDRVLDRYQRASFAGPFAVRWGELLNAGGTPVDLGMDHCGTICRVILCDFGYGGEVVPRPVIFMVGGYAFDDATGTAQVTPFQSIRYDLPGMLSMMAGGLPVHLPPKPKPKPKPKHTKHHVVHHHRARKHK